LGIFAMANLLRSRSQVQTIAKSALKTSLKSNHNRLVTLGLVLVGLVYLPIRLVEFGMRAIHNSTTLLMLGLAILGCYFLWQQWGQLRTLEASPEDRWIGQSIMVVSIALFPFAWITNWTPTIISMMILLGIAYSYWGVAFLGRCALGIFLIVAGLLPNPSVLLKNILSALMPPLWLEYLSAHSGYWALRLIGQPAEINGHFLKLAGTAVEVSWGCTPFNMAAQVAIAGWIAGLCFKLSRSKVTEIILWGMGLACLTNVPRLAILVLAKAYWGENSFNFWHDGWGGQIFMGSLFTVYYYLVMWTIKRSEQRSQT
jgi:exosortase/archaeosortase family protein